LHHTNEICSDVGFIFELLKKRGESRVHSQQSGRAPATLPRNGDESKECRLVRPLFSAI
jgi:hypothetical protein